jgi:hypothetical protein
LNPFPVKRFSVNLLGGETHGDTIVQRFSEDQTIGLVFPDDPNLLVVENLPAEILRAGSNRGTLPKPL